MSTCTKSHSTHVSDQKTEDASPANTPYDFTRPGAPIQQQIPSGAAFNVSGHQTGRGQSPGAFSMSGMAGALSDYQPSVPGQIPHHDQQRFLIGTAGSAYPGQQFPGQSPMNPVNYANHPGQYSPAYHQGYQIQQSPQAQSGGPNTISPSYPVGSYVPAQQQQYVYYPGQYAQSHQAPLGSFPSSYGPGSYPQQVAEMTLAGSRLPTNSHLSGVPSSYVYGSGGTYLRPGSLPGKLRI